MDTIEPEDREFYEYVEEDALQNPRLRALAESAYGGEVPRGDLMRFLITEVMRHRHGEITDRELVGAMYKLTGML